MVPRPARQGRRARAAGEGECPARVGVARAPPADPRPSPPRSLSSSSLPPLLPPRTPRLRPCAGGAPHCTLWGRRSVRGMGKRAAAGGRNPRAARVSRGGLPGRAQKETGLVPAALTNAGSGRPSSGLSPRNYPMLRHPTPPLPGVRGAGVLASASRSGVLSPSGQPVLSAAWAGLEGRVRACV